MWKAYETRRIDPATSFGNPEKIGRHPNLATKHIQKTKIKKWSKQHLKLNKNLPWKPVYICPEDWNDKWFSG